jgi:TRAP-type C4-dicarboxylate transport system permease small subunit
LDAAPGDRARSTPLPLRWLHAAETALLVAAVLALVGLSAAQIVARTLFDGGWAWVDPLTRALVLWTAMLGALAAARDDRHINLDALTRLLRGTPLRFARFVTFAFAAGVSALLAWYGWQLVLLDRESGTPAFGFVQAWHVELILPVGFGLLALRFLVRAFVRPQPPSP